MEIVKIRVPFNFPKVLELSGSSSKSNTVRLNLQFNCP
jgi:hypothetical protein